MSNCNETCITISTDDCIEACNKGIAYYTKRAKELRDKEIADVMARKPKKFLFWVDRSGCANTPEEAIKVINQERHQYLNSVNWLEEERCNDIRALRNLCEFTKEITLSKKDIHLIRFWLKKRG
jgi:phosphopantetheine adenylyltransferase